MAYNDDGAAAPTLLLTRPRAASMRFALEIAARWPGARVVIAPLMEVVPTGAPPVLDGLGAAIFTSGNAVARASPGDGLRAYCIGARTAEAAALAGFDAVMAGETADELVERLVDLRPEGPLLHLHGVHQRGDVVPRLAAAGIDARGTEVYDQRAVPPDTVFFDALAARPLLVPLFSPRSAALFREAAEPVIGVDPAGMHLFALSAAVRDALPPGWHGATDIAARPDAEALLDDIARRIFT
ncbi:uroporphyrinogen-III synthase [Roseicyclus sp.]|uniref:uroporphyrinogen-III synthase n=1 Tax=Roseicyclus sp. TaxID=1914329 RepID=UPI003FA00F1C